MLSDCKKKFSQHGCFCIQSEYGAELASLVDYLGRKKSGTDIQILTVSSKEAFGEYAPYIDAESESDFISKVLAM